MGKKYLDTKENSIESAVLQVWQEAAKKLDPVGQEDDDVDNDGDVDSSDKYLAKRRKAISKEIKKDKKKSPEQVDEIIGTAAKLAGKAVGGAAKLAGRTAGAAAKVAGRTVGGVAKGAGSAAAGAIKGTKKAVGGAASGTKKAVGGAASATKKVVGSITSQYEGLEDSPNAANSQHLCAKNVVHEEWGEGQPVHGMHAIPDADGNIAWYDVMFEHGIEKGVSINELKVRAAESHHDHKRKKNEGAMKRGPKDMDTFKPKPQNEGTKQVLAHGGKGQYKAVRDGGITKIMYKGKVVGTADFDSGADSFFVSMKGVKGQKSFDDAQAMVDYFAKNKITEELEMRDFNEYQNFKVESMRSAIEEVWEVSADDKLFEDINLLSEEDYDDFLETLNEEELNELIRALGRGIKKIATYGTAASKADRAEKKQKKAEKRGADLARVKAAKEKTAAAREANPTLGMRVKSAIMGKPKTVTSKAGNKMVAGPDGKATTTRAEGVDLDELTADQKKKREASRGPEGREHGGISQTKGVNQSNDGNQAHRAKRGYYPVGSAKRDDFKPKPKDTAALKKALQDKRK
jgi:hypothetical protein